MLLYKAAAQAAYGVRYEQQPSAFRSTIIDREAAARTTTTMAPASSAAPFLPTTASSEATLPPSFVREEDERPKVPHDSFSDEVPVISLDGIGGGERRAEIRARVAAACEDWGIFQVVDHGVDAALVAEMARLARDFFALPPQEKLRFDMSGGKKGGFIVSSHLQGEAVQDWREIVTYFSYPVKARDYSRWPDKPAAWRAVVEQYSEQLVGLSCKLLGVLSEAMGLEAGALAEACVEMDQKVVVNFYPRCQQPDLTLGLKRHTDPGTITLLLQDLVGGLQATRDGGRTWITVQPVEGAFVVNLGDHGHVQERRPPGGGELGVQPAVDRDVPEPGAGRDGVPAGRAGGGGAHPGRAHHLRRDVPAQDGARHRGRQAQEAGQGGRREAAGAGADAPAERQRGVRRAQARVTR
nr:flavanone 3-dioxygenase 1 isoform X2 [Setaria viridis]